MCNETPPKTSVENAVKAFSAPADMVFTRIDTELARHYKYVVDGKPHIETIEEPVFLHVSASGGHRIFDVNLRSHYIQPGWKHLYWDTRPGHPHFVK